MMQRRDFIRLSGLTMAAALYSRITYASSPSLALINAPDEVLAMVNDQWVKLQSAGGSTYAYKDLRVELKSKNNAKAVEVLCPSMELQAVKLKWKFEYKGYSKVLGDHWERSYGDLGWKNITQDAKNPWYTLINDGRHTACFGVMTGTNTLCWWALADHTLSLTMDTRSGAAGVKLGGRILHAASIVTMMSKDGESAYAAATRFCTLMCNKPRLPKLPVYGINDWYAVYGNNSSESIRRQTAFMAELVTDTVNRPFSVIDDGWEQPDDFSRSNEKFKDMHQMADEIKGLGMRPGLWTRPLIAKQNDPLSLLAPKIPGRNDAKELILDPTIPENIERVKYNMSVYRQWGYEMVKHDYSSWDIFGRWGFQMNDQFTVPGWKFYDQSKTNAEIVGHLYQSIRTAAGDMYIIGCNTLSHLSAGLFELNRTGDDTSGKEWARTRKMGVNTLGFRLPQHNTFYAADGDCVGLTADVAWEKNRQWLQLLAESGSPLFISAQLEAIGAEQKTAIKKAFAQAAQVQPTGEPLDWMGNQFPERWKLNNREVTFNWD